MDIQGLEELSQSLHLHSFHPKSGSCWKVFHEGHTEIFQRGHLLTWINSFSKSKIASLHSLWQSQWVPVCASYCPGHGGTMMNQIFQHALRSLQSSGETGRRQLAPVPLYPIYLPVVKPFRVWPGCPSGGECLPDVPRENRSRIPVKTWNGAKPLFRFTLLLYLPCQQVGSNDFWESFLPADTYCEPI